MAFPTRYSTRAYLEYEEIIEYVFNKFGAGTALKVDLYFEEVIDRISSHPYLFPYFDETKNIRRCVISPQTTPFYRFSGEFVELVSFRGNKLNPKTLNL